jgi:hypothetical protein
MERSGRNSRRVGIVLTEIPPAGSRGCGMCERWGTRISLGLCGDDGGREMNFRSGVPALFLSVIVGIATGITNGTDGLSGPTA